MQAYDPSGVEGLPLYLLFPVNYPVTQQTLIAKAYLLITIINNILAYSKEGVN
jgi:hypothetical protein